ncbi:MAG: PH domain-containing protein [Flavobacteriia bacterium]|nr:PH domain-containing protein [Flavobacteriia bacterium]
MKIYKSRKNKFYKLGYILPFVFVSTVIFVKIIHKDKNTLSEFINGFTIAFLLTFFWYLIQKKLTYIISQDTLTCKFLLTKQIIELSKVTKIKKQKSRYIATKTCGLASFGLILFYNKYDELYISPEKEVEFITDLLNQNPRIIIEDFN